ncbi:DNA internalization-related competence protein ComEC/Rec2 [Halomonas cupida]|uniref:DNA internalization-related competence protein ComEC/Rec2 n=1 Tax=Halomonas TaxID=2745 RepID=UPI001A8E8832|nr:DNA internalization-related competence protein ComEC/Rec2 [Halomonas litopenaei]MBN8410831.1 DNA internalization-related competence protein ComEC/Rec2 [Halomonas litopenaei]
MTGGRSLYWRGAAKAGQRSRQRRGGGPAWPSPAVSLASGATLGGALIGVAEPAMYLLLAVAVASLAARRWRLLLGAWVALWVLLSLLQQQGARLPAGLAGVTLLADVRVSAARELAGAQRLTLEIERCEPMLADMLACDRLERVRVTHYLAAHQAAGLGSPLPSGRMTVGERWRLALRLRPPTGVANPGRFDYERWLWQQGIQAIGAVVSEPPPYRRALAPEDLRESLLATLEGLALAERTRRWLAALTLGRGERLEAQEWQLLNSTGTTHLAVVSGLHVGLVAVLALGCGRWLSRRIQPGRWRLVRWPWWWAGGFTAGFVWLVGAEPPALRALVMIVIALWVAGGRHAPSAWQGLAVAWTLVVLIDPLSLWRPGLWLSFGAVAALIIMWQGRGLKPHQRSGRGVQTAWVTLVRTQLLLALPMAGLVLAFTGQVSLVTVLANLVAVPLVSLILVPAGMLGWAVLLVAPPLALWWWKGWGWVLAALLELLEGLSLPAATVWLDVDIRLSLALLLWGIGVVICLPGIGRGLKGGAVIALGVALISLAPARPDPRTVRLVVWDVGQGLMVEVHTAGHRLLYDSGPRYASGYAPIDGIWPSPQQFDQVIISHADLDHSGGVARLVEQHEVAHWWHPAGRIPGLPAEQAADGCHWGQQWRWEGVDFRFLWPGSDEAVATLESNDQSCVLLVSSPGGSVLITGDASRRVERYLIAQLPSPPAVLVVGHHGSDDSTGAALIDARAPQLAVASSAAFNRFGHPHDDVIRRLRQAGSCILDTGLDGQLVIDLDRAGVHLVSSGRRRHLHGGVEGLCHGVESRH